MARSFGLVDDKVEEAAFFLEHLEATSNMFDARCYMSAFASACRSVTFAMQASLSDTVGFREWYEAQQVELRTNERANYFNEVRRLSEHVGLSPITGGATNRTAGGGAASRPIVRVGSESVARAVVRGGRAYVSWLPIDGTRKRAMTFLSRGAPFTTLTNAEKATLERAHAIRNALAHPGSHALRRFQVEVIGGLAVPPDQKQPDGYLRGQHAVGQTRFEYLLAECDAVFRRLCG